MPCSVLRIWISLEELAREEIIKRRHLLLEYVVFTVFLSLSGLHDVLHYRLVSVNYNDSPITLNSSFITAWYPEEKDDSAN